MARSGAGPPLRAALERTRLVVRLPSGIAPSDVAPACARVRALLAASRADQLVCDLAELGPPDLAVVDALARLTLAARRLGLELGVRGATAELVSLLEALGLAEVVQVVRPSR